MRIQSKLARCPLLRDNRSSPVLTAVREAMGEYGFSGNEIDYLAERLTGVLDDCASRFGEGKEIGYIVYKRLGRVETLISLPGERYDPFEGEGDAKNRAIERALHLNLNSQGTSINHSYFNGRNVIVASVPLDQRRKSFLRDPILLATVLGIITGLICLRLPESANQFVIGEILNPLMSIVLKILTAVMGPFIYISLVSSIIALDSISDLTELGLKIFGRFVRIILFFIAVSAAVALLFFGNFGAGNADFSPNQIITMLLSIIPVNVVSPFLESNMPQIVVLAFLSGVTLLLLGDRVSGLAGIIHQCNEWSMKIVSIVLKIAPLVPFLSLATAIGQGNAGILKEGWKFILAVYLAFTICIVVKLIKTTRVTKIPLSRLLKVIKAPTMTALATAQGAAAVNQMYEASDELGIKREFTSFFIPMCSAMLSLKTTVNVVIATIMMTQIMGIPISINFLFVLLILTFEMSFASPGTISSWVIAFEALAMPTSYVGLFTTYRILYNNYTSAVVLAYDLCEEAEAACRLGAMDAD